MKNKIKILTVFLGVFGILTSIGWGITTKKAHSNKDAPACNISNKNSSCSVTGNNSGSTKNKNTVKPKAPSKTTTKTKGKEKSTSSK